MGICFRGEALADDDLENGFGATEIGFDVERGSLGMRNSAARLFGFDGLLELFARFTNGANCRVILFAEAAFASGVNVADDPESMLDVIEGEDAVIESQNGIEETDVVAQARWYALDKTNHVVGKIADGTGYQRRQAWNTDRAKFLHASAEKCDGIFFFPHDA